jgi:hypothetical protein
MHLQFKPIGSIGQRMPYALKFLSLPVRHGDHGRRPCSLACPFWTARESDLGVLCCVSVDHCRAVVFQQAERIVTEIAQAMAVLDDAFRRCREEDMRTPDVFAALDYLEAKSMETWPFDQFRHSLQSDDPEGRWQNLNASLNGIRRVMDV